MRLAIASLRQHAEPLGRDLRLDKQASKTAGMPS